MILLVCKYILQDVGKLLFLPRSIFRAQEISNDQLKVKGFVARVSKFAKNPSWREAKNPIYHFKFDDQTYTQFPLRMMYENRKPLYSPGVLVLKD